MNDTQTGNGCCNPGDLCVCRLAMAIALTWALGLLLLGLVTSFTTEYGHEVVKLIGNVYIGYDTTVVGALIGFVWGFVDAFIAIAVVGFIYAALSKRGGSCCCKSDKPQDAPPA